MKKLLFAALAVFAFSFSNAQEEGGSALSKGSWVIEANTGFGGDGVAAQGANTGFGLYSVDGTTVWAIGAEAGYFLADDLALKVGLGYTDFDGSSNFTYKLGAKYYIDSQFPVQVDLTGASSDDVFGSENPLWLGLQGGYAWFVADNISIEPGLRYNLSLNEDFTDEGLFEFRIGFALHF
ncbi:hypothetical protein DFQ05_0577 [Winogradskyella wandonensis]|uniref:Outer membrane protein with beta-barrel domain n=1 Tax=Winogradskyella wandonensis TaxID=1442586 RepID=A0A4R1KV53_9FLAO|nr:hypothetical protein [Winogradskyella wandonensis]TCK69065.1 hypothetical protein DFQ05_0577 [Winogradskyella wandonensis]